MWLPEVESCLPAALPCGTGAARLGVNGLSQTWRANSSSNGTHGHCPNSQPNIWGGLRATGVPLKPDLY